MSGLRHTLGKRAYVNSVPGVRIPLSPPIGIKVEPRQKDMIRYIFVDGVAGLIAFRERKQISYASNYNVRDEQGNFAKTV